MNLRAKFDAVIVRPLDEQEEMIKIGTFMGKLLP